KMSKSLGNIIDPLDLIDGIDLESLVGKRTSGLMQPHLRDRIEKNTRKQFPKGIAAYGADALRFTLCALATMGRDIRFDLGRIEGYKNFANKLWNATRYVLMNTEGQDCGQGAAAGACDYSAADRWIRSRLGAAAETVRARFAEYRFDLAAQALYEFAWYEYCDWYLELSKPTLQSDAANAAQKRGTRQTLVTVLEGLTRLMHPMMPFITEEIWQALLPVSGQQGQTIMLQPYPTRADFPLDDAAERAMTAVKAAILGARQIRGQLEIPQSREIAIHYQTPEAGDRQAIEANLAVIKYVGRIADLRAVPSDAALPPSASAIVERRTISSPLAGLIDDPAAELARLQKRKAKATQDLAREDAKLSNQSFLAGAPAELVAVVRERTAEARRQIAQIEEQERLVRTLK
ncbi:MAG: class I tRNA ligase family protein, partial [Steroidobacteraceae bacterium]